MYIGTVEQTSEKASVLFTGGGETYTQIEATARQRMTTNIAGWAYHTLLWASKQSWHRTGHNPNIST